jgi:hypothetical protein
MHQHRHTAQTFRFPFPTGDGGTQAGIEVLVARPELVELLVGDILAQRLVLPKLKPAAPEQIKAQVGANVERFLGMFARQGILE